MDVKVAEAKALELNAEMADAAPLDAEVAQPASKELADKTPSGSMGALAKNLSASRREGFDNEDMVVVFRVLGIVEQMQCKLMCKLPR